VRVALLTVVLIHNLNFQIYQPLQKKQWFRILALIMQPQLLLEAVYQKHE